jgi:hypothetical protein
MLVFGRRRELAIEFLLLLRGQQSANLIVSLKDELLMLPVKIFVQLLHPGPGIAYQCLNLMELIRGQVKFAIEALDEMMRTRHDKHSMAVGGSRKSESDQHPRHHGQGHA